MSLSKTAVSVVSVALTFAVTLLGFHFLKGTPPKIKAFDISDSPIDMGGGSIYGISANGWQPGPAGAYYQYTTASSNQDINQVTTSGLDHIPPATMNGWVMILSDRRSDGNTEKAGAVIISTDQNSPCFTSDNYDCGAPPAIAAGQTTIYMKIRNDSWVTFADNSNHLNNEFRFHDSDCDGAANNTATQDKEDLKCDRLQRVIFISQDIHQPGNNHLNARCGSYAKGHCEIAIGLTQ